MFNILGENGYSHTAALFQLQDQILRESYNPSYGARPMRRYVDKYIATEVSRLIISGRLADNMNVIIDETAHSNPSTSASHADSTLRPSIGRFSFKISDKPAL